MKALTLALLLCASGAAFADPADDAILKCRAQADTAVRLACYDAIQVGAARPAQPPAQAAAAAPARSAEQNFGMEAVKQKEAQPNAIESSIAGEFEGWGPGSQIRLANGQVWRIVDGSEAVLPRMRNPKVKIERNVFGTLFLKIEGSNSSAKVRRVQ
ncbi:hypothetical protein [Massilia sp. ST3]|uniref:hypothetical protein n=1 Tax=Massilia sp. ST3 TaxID=2824903 RepID=UPI001B811EDB|nr:hypothetical protein [Massilia sp. ST3]MBQ5946698.1 hypothetical protein [Massilia sp. ST3]